MGMGMDHSRLSDEEWEHIRYLDPKTAYIQNVWLDEQQNVHVEVVHEASQRAKAVEERAKDEEAEKALDEFLYGPEIPSEWFVIPEDDE